LGNRAEKEEVFMRSPVQATPVRRGIGRAQQFSMMAQSGCDVFDWIECAGIVAACIPACSTGVPQCIACMGAAYDKCKDCL
jgi:hypothetical protein